MIKSAERPRNKIDSCKKQPQLPDLIMMMMLRMRLSQMIDRIKPPLKPT